MIPVDQSKLHDPPRQNGNCLAAALASILEIDIEDVPEFEDMSYTEWYPRLKKWLELLGFHLLIWDEEIYLPTFFIAHGPSPRGDWEHSVIYKGTKMVHDPHPSREGLERITSVWALLPIDPKLTR